MADLIFVVIVVAFFALCVAFVKGCDLIIGPDPAPAEVDESAPAAHAAEAVDASR